MSKATYIPAYLDEPELLFIWTFDEAGVLIAPVFIGVMLGFFLIGILVGVAGVTIYSRAKQQVGTNLLSGLLYWYFPASLSGFHATPPSYIREYVG